MSNPPRSSSERISLEELLGLADHRSLSRGWWWFPSPKSRRVAVPCDSRGWKPALNMVETPRKRALAAILLCSYRIMRRPPHLYAAAKNCPLDRWLAEVWPGVKLRYAIYRGTPNIFVKDSIQCQSIDGRVLGYVKVPRGLRACEAVANEASALRTLADHFPDDEFYPRILGSEWLATVQSAGPEAPQTNSLIAAGKVTGLLARKLSLDFCWQDSPEREEIVRAIAVIRTADLTDRADRLAESLAKLDAGLGDAVLPHPFSHGDLVPWNFSAGGFLFDWEWAAYRLPLHDAFHHLWMPHILGRARLESSKLQSRWSEAAAAFTNATPQLCLPVLGLLSRAYLLWQSSFYDVATLDHGDSVKGVRLLDRLHKLAASPPLPEG